MLGQDSPITKNWLGQDSPITKNWLGQDSLLDFIIGEDSPS